MIRLLKIFQTIEKKLKELESETVKEEFWQKAPSETGKVLAQIKQLKSKVEQYKKIESEILNLQDLTELANMENREAKLRRKIEEL